MMTLIAGAAIGAVVAAIVIFLWIAWHFKDFMG